MHARLHAVGATVIGVNNRDLRSFNVDTSKTGRVLAQAGLVGPGSTASGKVLLALSGIASRVDVQGYEAIISRDCLCGPKKDGSQLHL